MVRQQAQAQIVIGIEVMDLAGGNGVVSGGILAGEDDGLIATQSYALVRRLRVAPTVLQVDAGAHDEESRGEDEALETGKVDVAPIHGISGADERT